MNVGILTFQWANNYGALLQAHALCQALKSLGHQPRLIRFTPKNSRAPRWKGWGLNCGREMPAFARKRFRFERFRNNTLCLTRPCDTTAELLRISRKLDALIVGSDQVWNGHIVGPDVARYFCDFVSSEDCTLISYAATFGDADQPHFTLHAAREHLPKFHHLSVRDDLTARLVEDLAGRRAELVVDPTLLHDFSDFPVKAPVTGPYIACYYVSSEHKAIGREVVQRTRDALGLPVVAIGARKDELGADHSLAGIGPIEWVQAIHGASYLCTDSFHGTIFALKSETPFTAWRGHRPGRLSHLLDPCGLGERLLGDGAIECASELAGKSISFAATNACLAPHVDRSLEYLRHALVGSAMKPSGVN